MPDLQEAAAVSCQLVRTSSYTARIFLGGHKLREGDTVEFRIERRGADGKPWAKEVRRVDGQ